MFRKTRIHKFLTSLTATALLFVYSNVAFAQTTNLGEITVTGNVTVNGERAVSGSTIGTDSVIVTGANSGAVINLTGRGKVELFADTSITLKFTDRSIVAILTSGKIRVMNLAGIGATVTTRSATVVADTGRANSFIVTLGCNDDNKCHETFVETVSGFVTMTSHNDQVLRQIPAGASAASGPVSDSCSKACIRPGTLPIALDTGLNRGLIAIILGGFGAGVLAAILLGGNNAVIVPVPIVSPNQ